MGNSWNFEELCKFVAAWYGVWALWKGGVIGILGKLCKVSAAWYGPSGKGEFLAFWEIMVGHGSLAMLFLAAPCGPAGKG